MSILIFEDYTGGSGRAAANGGHYLVYPVGASWAFRFDKDGKTTWESDHGTGVTEAEQACQAHFEQTLTDDPDAADDMGDLQPTPPDDAMKPVGKPTYVVFDTENNGLFEYKDPNTKVSIPADAPGQPRLASICVIIADQVGDEMSRTIRYIKPDGWSIHDHDEKSRAKGKATASEVNGLTDDYLMENGVPVQQVLDEWHQYIDQGLIVTAYNAQHDNKQMRAELRRAGMDDRFEETKNTCLMRSLKPYKDRGLPVAGWGMVKLTVACEFFGIVLENAHDAEADTVAALGVLKILLRDGNLIEPKVHYAAKPAGSE